MPEEFKECSYNVTIVVFVHVISRLVVVLNLLIARAETRQLHA